MAQIIAEYIRRHGPFMPHRLGPEEMEYTTLPQVLEKLKDRFVVDVQAMREVEKYKKRPVKGEPSHE